MEIQDAFVILNLTETHSRFHVIKPISNIYKRIKKFSTSSILKDPIYVMNEITNWFHNLRDAEPMEGYNALRRIIERGDSNVITNNFDKLHHKTGIVNSFYLFGKLVKEDDDQPTFWHDLKDMFDLARG